MNSETDVKTFVFMDLETTPAIMLQEYIVSPSTVTSSFYANKLHEFIKKHPVNNCTRITEVAFMAVLKEDFEKSARKMNENYLKHGRCSLQPIRSTNYYSLVRPIFTEEQWESYSEMCEDLDFIVHPAEDLRTASTLREIWPDVYSFLDGLPKPICLIAHNGVKFDFRVLYYRLKKANIDTTTAFPEQTYFMDTFLTFRYFDRVFVDELKAKAAEIDEHSFAERSERIKEADWSDCIAKRMRWHNNGEYFRTNENGVVYDVDAARKGKKINLVGLYKEFFRKDFNAHHAKDDTEALFQVSLTYGQVFLDSVKQLSAKFPSV